MMEEIIRNAHGNQRKKDTYRDKNGLLCCRACGKPVETFVEALGKMMPSRCDCDDWSEETEASTKRCEKAEKMAKESPLYSSDYDRETFGRDDSPDSAASRQCRAYVENWTEMEAGNFGILFSGPTGTSKSFYAAAIVNALRAKGVSALIVTTSRLVNKIRSVSDPQAIIDGLNTFDLVALDDLGAERDTGYAVEQLENFINARSLRGKPLIVTTNLPRKDMDTPENMAYARIFDRVRAMCCHSIVLTGESRRVAQAKERAKRCKEILGT